jgi:hypothetical protein
MILARLLGRTLYVGRDRTDCPFIALARTALHTDCVCGPELRVTWQQWSSWGFFYGCSLSIGRLSIEYI